MIEKPRPVVLVVEDDIIIGWDICEQLKRAGFDVLELAESGPRAHALLDEGMPDAAVIDVNLGDHTSASVVNRLNDNLTPFVTLTGYDRSQLDEIYHRSPILTKPVVMDSLLSHLNDATDSLDS